MKILIKCKAKDLMKELAKIKRKEEKNMAKEIMTVQDIVEEFGIAEPAVYRIFKDPELPVQNYTKPQFILRSKLLEYFEQRHDYLSNN